MLQNTSENGNAYIHLLKGKRDEFRCFMIELIAGGHGCACRALVRICSEWYLQITCVSLWKAVEKEGSGGLSTKEIPKF